MWRGGSSLNLGTPQGPPRPRPSPEAMRGIHLILLAILLSFDHGKHGGTQQGPVPGTGAAMPGERLCVCVSLGEVSSARTQGWKRAQFLQRSPGRPPRGHALARAMALGV